MTRQIDTDVETFVINDNVMCYVHDMLTNILAAIEHSQRFVTFKVMYVNLTKHKALNTKVSVELCNNDRCLFLDTLFTNLEIAVPYELL